MVVKKYWISGIVVLLFNNALAQQVPWYKNSLTLSAGTGFVAGGLTAFVYNLYKNYQARKQTAKIIHANSYQLAQALSSLLDHTDKSYPELLELIINYGQPLIKLSQTNKTFHSILQPHIEGLIARFTHLAKSEKYHPILTTLMNVPHDIAPHIFFWRRAFAPTMQCLRLLKHCNLDKHCVKNNNLLSTVVMHTSASSIQLAVIFALEVHEFYQIEDYVWHVRGYGQSGRKLTSNQQLIDYCTQHGFVESDVLSVLKLIKKNRTTE
jgi:hypothetical protein